MNENQMLKQQSANLLIQLGQLQLAYIELEIENQKLRDKYETQENK